MGDNEVCVLARRAIPADQITVTQARDMLRQAEVMPIGTAEETQARRRALQRARHMVKLANLERIQ